jgi:catechol 2,3-dioxygenase-like lactoylglutathione lyase family enzyme
MKKLTGILLPGLALAGAALGGASAERSTRHLGNFSVSLTVRDIGTSKAFYEKLGFTQILGDSAQGWAIMKNGSTNIGLFQGQFDRNVMTFNPGWNQDGQPDANSEDVRVIQDRLRAAGVDVGPDIESGSGPASFRIVDPDGNPILFDQHV